MSDHKRLGSSISSRLGAVAIGLAAFGLAWTPAGRAQDAYDIAFVASIKGEPFFLTMYCGVQDAAAKLGATTSYTAGEHFDPREQTAIFNAVTAKKPDAALVVPVDSQAMIPALQQMKAAGITTVEVDTKVDDTSISVSQIATDNYQGGQLAATTLARLISEEGTVLVINVQPGISSVDARQAGFMDEIKSFPNVTVLPVEFAGFDAGKAAAITTASLAAHPEIAGIFATASILGEGSATGLRQAGRTGEVKVVSFDPTPAVVAAFEAQIIDAIIAQDTYGIGYQGVEQAVLAMKGESTEKSISIPAVAITHDNVAETKKFYYRDSCS